MPLFPFNSARQQKSIDFKAAIMNIHRKELKKTVQWQYVQYIFSAAFFCKCKLSWLLQCKELIVAKITICKYKALNEQ